MKLPDFESPSGDSLSKSACILYLEKPSPSVLIQVGCLFERLEYSMIQSCMRAPSLIEVSSFVKVDIDIFPVKLP